MTLFRALVIAALVAGTGACTVHRYYETGPGQGQGYAPAEHRYEGAPGGNDDGYDGEGNDDGYYGEQNDDRVDDGYPGYVTPRDPYATQRRSHSRDRGSHSRPRGAYTRTRYRSRQPCNCKCNGYPGDRQVRPRYQPDNPSAWLE